MTQTEQTKLTELLLQTSKEIALTIRDFGPAPLDGLQIVFSMVPPQAFDMCIAALEQSGIITRVPESPDVWFTFVGVPSKTVN